MSFGATFIWLNSSSSLGCVLFSFVTDERTLIEIQHQSESNASLIKLLQKCQMLDLVMIVVMCVHADVHRFGTGV